ncbi:MAG: nucleotide exchange factor GrpE [Deltaproteobacteria bacterium]|nr:nucleotide exchange factor GrpE [Deltaproteobacteria bacterium]MBI4373408.1 nucleotide exchange factor GrpE [Deltaproteobacteria bacterium]
MQKPPMKPLEGQQQPRPGAPTPADSKIASLEEKIAGLEKGLQEMRNSYLLSRADLENYKKRAIKEREEFVQFTSERLLRELLDVKDHLELALDHARSATDIKPLHDGVELTLKQMRQFMEKFGVAEIQATGERFDPNFHEAIHEEAVEGEGGRVVREHQKGYLFNGRLLRPARVIVSKEKNQ